MNHSGRFRSLLADGHSREDALSELRLAGASPFDCIRAIHDVERVGLTTAKRLFSESASWSAVVDGTVADQIEELESFERDLLAILDIPRETSNRGAGLSLRDALSRIRYRELRSTFNEADLLAVLRDRPALVEEWLSYSENKRTSGGWYVLRNGDIGQVARQAPTIELPGITEAVAAYVVRELDFWAHIGNG